MGPEASKCFHAASLTSKGHETAAQIANESEDCLYLNVYAPAGCKGGKAVMFWIHGGDLTSGTSSGFDGTSFAANQDVVVVTINYRLNGMYSPPTNLLSLSSWSGALRRKPQLTQCCSVRLLQRAQAPAGVAQRRFLGPAPRPGLDAREHRSLWRRPRKNNHLRRVLGRVVRRQTTDRDAARRRRAAALPRGCPSARPSSRAARRR